jgi:hypothetical protein
MHALEHDQGMHANFLIAIKPDLQSRKLMNCLSLAIVAGLLLTRIAACDDTPKDSIPDVTVSPDKKYGVTVPPSVNVPDFFTKTNEIIELKSHRNVGWINAETAFARMNKHELLPAWWSADDTYLLWQVEGKWGMHQQELVCLTGGEIQWELDVLAVLERQILNRTEAAIPEKFLAASKANWGDGSDYPEKFTIDSWCDKSNKGPLKFPVLFHVFLTSNPKGAEGVPEVDSFMDAVLKDTGEITVTRFQLGRTKDAAWYQTQEDDRR